MTPADLRIAALLPRHAAEVLAIYQLGIDEGQATFETVAPDWARFDAERLPGHRHVALGADERVLGWAAVSAVSGRPAYAGVVEHSVYVNPGARGLGVGAVLVDALIASTEAAGIWTVQSGIFPENAASLALHRRAGFRVIGVRQRVGCHHGVWRDVVLVERRSPNVPTLSVPTASVPTPTASEPWRQAPVACSLTADGLGERAAQWQGLLVGAGREPIPDGLRLTLPADRAGELAALAAAEQQCCAFFDFRLHFDGPLIHLEVRAPDAARELVTALFGTIGPTSGMILG